MFNWILCGMKQNNRGALNYRDAGVDIDAGKALVSRIQSLSAATKRPGVMSDLGGLARCLILPRCTINNRFWSPAAMVWAQKSSWPLIAIDMIQSVSIW